MMSCDTSDLYFALQDDKFLCATCCIIGSILFTMWVQCRCIGHTGSLRTLLWSAWSRASAAYRTCKLAGGGGLYQLYEPWRLKGAGIEYWVRRTSFLSEHESTSSVHRWWNHALGANNIVRKYCHVINPLPWQFSSKGHTLWETLYPHVYKPESLQ